MRRIAGPLMFVILLTLVFSAVSAQGDQGEGTTGRINEFTTAAADPAAPRLLSAYFGLDNALPRSANRLCRGAMGQDGMPVIFSHPVDNATLQAEDFVVITADGTITVPFCVTLAPATDLGELRTVLLMGEFGTDGENPPVMVEIVGDILSGSGDPDATPVAAGQPAVNFIGQSIEVTPLEAGPFLVYAEQVTQDQWTRATRGTSCPSDGLVQVLRVAWAGGVTKPGGDEVDDVVREQYSVMLADDDGVEQTLTPFALADLGDGDNHHLLCLDTAGTPLSVTFAAGYLTDPNEDALNPQTTVPVQGLPVATERDEEVSLLEYHNGYWVTEMENPDLPVPLTIINDMHVDAAANSVTVYAQARLLTRVVAPPQVGPGACTETPLGDRACFHPDAVYLNGSGKELMAADGTGSWWVKHAWTLGGEGYVNCELRSQEAYNDCFYVEGVLLEDGLSMQVGAVEEGMEGFFNIRTPLLDEDPIGYRVTRYEPANLDAEAGEVDLTPTAQWELIWRCEEEPSALDNQMRSCPVIHD